MTPSPHWTRLARAIGCAGLLVGGSLLGSVSTGSAQTAPAPAVTDTPTATPTPTGAVTMTPTPTPSPTIDPATAAAITPTPTATPFVSGVPCATDDAHGPGGVRRSERRGRDSDGEGGDDENSTGNGRNEVILHNCTDQQLRVLASIQLNTIPGRVVAPLNEAYAEGSCVSCQTLSIALQVDLYSRDRANDVRPENYAVALNTSCTGCVTVARAIQYVQPVDDPQDVPEDVARTVDRLDNELRSIQRDPDITLPDAEARLNAVLDSFIQLGGSLGQQRQERHDDDEH